jgi:hypothetical protein
VTSAEGGRTRRTQARTGQDRRGQDEKDTGEDRTGQARTGREGHRRGPDRRGQDEKDTGKDRTRTSSRTRGQARRTTLSSSRREGHEDRRGPAQTSWQGWTGRSERLRCCYGTESSGRPLQANAGQLGTGRSEKLNPAAAATAKQPAAALFCGLHQTRPAPNLLAGGPFLTHLQTAGAAAAVAAAAAAAALSRACAS